MRKLFIERFIFSLSKLFTGTDFYKVIQKHRIYSGLNKDQLKELQIKKLDIILAHAISTTKKYSLYCNKISKNPIGLLREFPVINKREINSHVDDYISNLYDVRKLIKYESSGSTGYRSCVYLDKIEQANMRAILINWWEWNGYKLGDPILQTGMSEKRGLLKKLKDIFLNTTYIRAFDLSEKRVLKILLKAARKKKILFFGYASSLFEISKIAQKNNIKLDIRLAMSQGDKLFNHYTTKINEVFGCDVVEDYGLNEGFMVGQKADIPYFYIYTPSVFVEILDEYDQPLPDGVLGRIVLTKLDGFAMPLIRYDSGDIGSLLPLDEYPENRRFNFPLLKNLIGRNTDIIETKNGNKLTVHSFTGVFEFYEEIEQFQVILVKADCLTLKYIPSALFREAVIPMIEEKLRLLMGIDLKFSWVKVLSIPTSKSGKPQILINNLIQNSLSDQS